MSIYLLSDIHAGEMSLERTLAIPGDFDKDLSDELFFVKQWFK